MLILNCLVVENNSKQGSVLADYISKTPKLAYAGSCKTPEELYQHAILHKIDVIFWDIRLLDLQTTLLLKEAGHYPIIICLASRQEQEKKETDIDIFSYFSRPVSYDKFLSTIDNIRKYLSTPAYPPSRKSKSFVFIKSEYKIIKVKFEDILFCEGMKDYTQVYLKGKQDPLLTLNNLKSFSHKLPGDEFIRVHRSYVVSLEHIDSIARNEIYIGKTIIPIGDSFKEAFYEIIEWNS